MIDLEAAHRHSSNHREEVLASETCGCFYCLAIYPPSALTETTDEGRTFLCSCGVDALIGSASGYPITPEFLEAMQKRWFGS